MSRKPGDQIERKEDPFTVGLSRYKKEERKLPEWVIEYGGWIVAGCLFLFVVLPFGILGFGSLGGSTPSGQAQLARLEMVATPYKVWAPGSNTRLQSIEVQVANRGPGTAEGVKVWVLGGPKQIVLKGPGTIESGKMASFSGSIDADIPAGKQVEIFPECVNCGFGLPEEEGF